MKYINQVLSQFLFAALFVFTFTACQSTPTVTCGPEIRAAFDVGSGSTKMKVTEFNTCTQSVTKVLLEDQRRVNYQDSLQSSPDQSFSQEVQTQGLSALKSLKEKALAQNAKRFSGVATAAFRKAKNANTYVEFVRKDLQIPIHIISQEQEALLGFKGAAVLSLVPAEKLLLWDIGGGSQQMVALNEQKEPQIYYGDLASVSFKNYIISTLQKKNIQRVKTPNPLGKSTTQKAQKYAEEIARTAVPAFIQNKIQEPGTQVVGIGGVLARSIFDQVSPTEVIEPSDILKSLRKRQHLRDTQIGGDFPQTEISNLALVFSYMNALKMKNYRPVQASLIDGLWYDSSYWE